jgi:hypothetical protein
MDPDTALEWLVDAVTAGDMDAAEDALDALLGWVACGGFDLLEAAERGDGRNVTTALLRILGGFGIGPLPGVPDRPTGVLTVGGPGAWN